MSRVIRHLAKHAFLVVMTLVLTGLMGEVLLRVKNSSQQNYVIEMWRYARDLKQISEDPRFGHIHIPNERATLQNVDIAINRLGMRGPEPRGDQQDVKKVLLLGSSITFGWGVEEKETLRGHLERELGAGYDVLNGGVGNYNLARSVAYFKERWRGSVKPDVVVVNFFINDAEFLERSSDNIVFRNSELAVTLYHIVQGYLIGSYDMTALIAHYREVYRPESRGYREMLSAIADLKAMSITDGFKVVFAMIPDVHQLQDYPFSFIHEHMATLVEKEGWVFVDYLKSLKGFRGPEIWAIPGDPHPNGVAHAAMAKQLAPYLK